MKINLHKFDLIVRVKGNRPSARRLASGGSASSDTQSFSDSGKSVESGGSGSQTKFSSDITSNGISHLINKSLINLIDG
jgi:hypothetical protein